MKRNINIWNGHRPCLSLSPINHEDHKNLWTCFCCLSFSLSAPLLLFPPLFSTQKSFIMPAGIPSVFKHSTSWSNYIHSCRLKLTGSRSVHTQYQVVFFAAAAAASVAELFLFLSSYFNHEANLCSPSRTIRTAAAAAETEKQLAQWILAPLLPVSWALRDT